MIQNATLIILNKQTSKRRAEMVNLTLFWSRREHWPVVNCIWPLKPGCHSGGCFRICNKRFRTLHSFAFFRVKHSTQFEQRTWWMRSSTAVSPVTSIGTLVLSDRTLNSGSCPVDTASTLDLFRFARQNFDVELSSLIQASELQAQSPRTTLICQLFWQLLHFSYVFQFCYTEWRHLHYTKYMKAKRNHMHVFYVTDICLVLSLIF